MNLFLLALFCANLNVQRCKSHHYQLIELNNNLINNKLPYPNYYTKSFHGYDHGNLNWDAAYEAVPATLSISSNYWNNSDVILSHTWLRNNFTLNINNYLKSLNIYNKNNNILDIGCSIGIGSEYLYKNIPNIKLTGLDLSPYFLSIAKLRSLIYQIPIKYIHDNAEKTNFSNNEFNIITSAT